MAIIRTKKQHGCFTIVHNNCLRNPDISLRAKGLFAYLMSLPDNWEINMHHLIKQSTEGRDAHIKAMKELIDVGYIVKIQARDCTGKFTKNDYEVIDIPTDEMKCVKNNTNAPFPGIQATAKNADNTRPQPENPLTANPLTEKPLTENPHLINTKNNKYVNNKKLTAAIPPATVKPSAPHQQKKSAAASSLDLQEKDLIIGEKLTVSQKRLVCEATQTLLGKIPNASHHQIDQEITDSLLNRNSFTFAGRDFHKKLNTIKKHMREGKWTPSPEKILERQAEQDLKIESLQREIRELEGAMSHWTSLQRIARERIESNPDGAGEDLVAGYQQCIDDTRCQLADARQRLSTLYEKQSNAANDCMQPQRQEQQ